MAEPRRTAGCFSHAHYRTPEEIKRRNCRACITSSSEPADVDITREPMEVGPTCHYMMGGIRVHPETQETTLPGLFAAGEVAGGMHVPNRLGGNSLSDLLVFGKRAGEFAAELAACQMASVPEVDQDEVARAVRLALCCSSVPWATTPMPFTKSCCMMHSYVGIVRSEEDSRSALDELDKLRQRAANVKVGGTIQYNPGWHLALDLANMLDVSEAGPRERPCFDKKAGWWTRGKISRTQTPTGVSGM